MGPWKIGSIINWDQIISIWQTPQTSASKIFSLFTYKNQTVIGISFSLSKVIPLSG